MLICCVNVIAAPLVPDEGEPETCDFGSIMTEGGECQPCGASTYANAGQTACVSCTEDDEYVDETGLCQTCPSGKYIDDEGNCEECPAGFFCVNGVATKCGNLRVSLAGQSSCTRCGRNTYPNEEHTECLACNEPNQYKKDSECKTCGAGYYMDDTKCVICPVGCSCSGNGAKETCLGNTIASKTGKTECDECPNGKYANDDHTKCLACSAGNCSEDNKCKPCPAGYRCPLNDDGVVYDCTSITSTQNNFGCPVGSYSASGQSECISCRTGYTSNEDNTGCVLKRMKLKFGENSVLLPNCLTWGDVNTKIIEQNP